eukprot:TRINITY_DN40510_c0_g1_i1.p1 TRINITY_DN40510_c0_g1~~TRINITY_DN40510_c0_g1_i1.p1  ORF type:complete len:131 (+),score=35.70 TRINITY_DN40510_c0_g1_i1:43-435(+)
MGKDSKSGSKAKRSSVKVVQASLKQRKSRSKVAMEDGERVRAHAFVSGKVQGVFYRNNTVKQAQERSLSGWVRNLCDGRVELQAQGTKEQVEDLLRWCHDGPAKAKVKSVDVSWVDPEEDVGSFKKIADA